jgi:hypothetical protein
VSALTPVDDGQTGLLAGYVVADYVAQHIRRTDCPPRSAWETLIFAVEEAEDLRRIAALARRIEEMRATSASSDSETGRRLAEMFVDGGEADALRIKADAGSLLAEEDLAALLADRGAVDELRERADQDRQPAVDALAELLAAHGRTDALQQRADAGDQAASRQLAKLLASKTTEDGAAVQAQLADLRRRISAGDEVAARD